MDKPKVSIIIPVYNTELYLSKCIDSILNQTYSNFELILINDGSTDNSKNICESYVKRDSRINFIDKKNTGSSDCRNLGIIKSKGKYITFIDSDDWIESNMLEESVDILEKNNLEMLINGISIDIVNKDGDVKSNINNYKYTIWTCKEEIRNNIIDLFPNALINSSCNKIYRLDYIKSINAKFPNTEIGEDTLFNLLVIKDINSIGINDVSYYHYMRYENNNTLTTKIIENAYEKYINIHNKMFDLFSYWDKRSNEVDSAINKTMFAQYIATTSKILNAAPNIYNYKVKKKMLNDGLQKEIVLNTFDFNKAYSYKDKLYRFTIKKRLYPLTLMLIKLSQVKHK